MSTLGHFTLHSPAVNRRELPHFMDTYKELCEKDLDFAFGVKTDFSVPGHGQRVRDMTFRDPNVWSFYEEEDVFGFPSDEPHFTLALIDDRDEYVASLIVKWVPKSHLCDARFFVCSINSPPEHVKLLFEVFERMVEHLWRSYHPCEYFHALKMEDYMELFVFSAIVPDECIAAMELCDFHYDRDNGMVLKGIGFV